MTHLNGAERAAYVQAMFTRVARYYDRMNGWLTGGLVGQWRRPVIDLAQLPPAGRLLDIGAGTGDLAREALRRAGALRVVGGDFTLAMMQAGRARRGGQAIRWVGADALHLPFPAESFEAVVSGYLLRNVVDVRQAWREQYRVLKPGGYGVCLDTTPPPADWLHGPVRFYLRVIIPGLGRLIAGDAEAYRYLPQSTEQFMPAEELRDCMRQAGFKAVRFRRFMWGTQAIHWGYK